jgi:hypothetical protein
MLIAPGTFNILVSVHGVIKAVNKLAKIRALSNMSVW